MCRKVAENAQKVPEAGGVRAVLEGSNPRGMGKSAENDLFKFYQEIVDTQKDTIRMQKKALDTTREVLQMLMERMDSNYLLLPLQERE